MSNLFRHLRILVALIVLMGCTAEAGAQLRYGLRLGGDFAKATLGGDLGAGAYVDNGSGFSGGLALEYQFRKCGFAPDIAVLYTRYDARLRLSDSGPLDFGRDFIEIPLRLKWKFLLPPTKDLVAAMIYTGPSLLVRCGHDDGVSLGAADQHRFATKRLQPGWDLGVGFDIINFIQLTAGYRFGLGNAASVPHGAELRTDGWQVAATMLFDF